MLEPIATYSEGVGIYRINRITKYCTGIIVRVAMKRAGVMPPPYPNRFTSFIKLALVSLIVFLAKHTKVGQWFPSPSGILTQMDGNLGESTDSPANG